MKLILILLVCFLGLPFFGEGQSVITAENPIAHQYLLKHFGLHGKVKAITTFGSNNYLMTDEIFDIEGRVTTKVSYSGIATTYTFEYDKVKKIITVSQKSGSLSPLKNLYQYNQNQEVEFNLYKENDPLRKFDYTGTLLIKDSSANKFSTQKVYYSYYEYNSKGQIAKLKAFNGDGKPSREEVYTYENNIVTIKGKTYWTIGKIDEYEKKKYYDKKGSLIKFTYTQNGKTEITEYKLDAQGNWIWKTGGMTRKITYYDEVKNASIKTVTKSNATLAVAEKKEEVKVISPEPYETTYKNELAAANDYKARGLAFAKYVDGLMITPLTDKEKETLLVEKAKEMMEIDFMGYHYMVMKIKQQNISFIIQKVQPSLTVEQKSAFMAASQYAIDEYVSMQNNTSKPMWPSNLPKPGYGWGKTESSDKVVYAATPVQSNSHPKTLERDIQSLIGSYWTKLYGGENVVFKIIGYKKHAYKQDGFTYNIKTTQEYKGNGISSNYYCSPSYRELDAEEIFYPHQYSLIKEYKSQSTFTKCSNCNGNGTVTQTFSHTNDYRYTLGSKTTYSATTKKSCKACNGGGYVNSAEDKAIACLDSK